MLTSHSLLFVIGFLRGPNIRKVLSNLKPQFLKCVWWMYQWYFKRYFISFTFFYQQFVKNQKSLLKCIGFWKPATPSKEKLANKPHDNNRCWAQQIYQQLGKLSEPKSTEQEEKSAPPYDNGTRELTPMWKSRYGIAYADDVAWRFWFWSEFWRHTPIFHYILTTSSTKTRAVSFKLWRIYQKKVIQELWSHMRCTWA